MDTIEQDLVLEQALENFIPQRYVSTTGFLLLILTIIISGLLLMAYIFPNPETVKGEVCITSAYQANIYVNVNGTGEIKKGMLVHIFIYNYKRNKYGFLTGRVVKFANNGRPTESGYYIINVSLTNGLKTNFGITLNSNLYLQGNGEIIIKEQSFLDSIIENI